MKALITGAGGFLGQYLAELLTSKGWLVRGFCRRSYPELEALDIPVIRGDLRNREATVAACRGVDTVFHVAGIAGIWGPWKDYYQTNTLGTQYVLEGCQAHGVGRLIYTSSPSVTFDGTPQEGIDESAPYASRWLCHYPHSKALAEQRVLEANRPGELLTCALRPHLVWGPRDQHLIPRLLQRARQGQLRRVGAGTNLIDMIYVENAALAHLKAAEALRPGSPVAGQAYFVSQGEPVNLWQWISQILAQVGLSLNNRSISLSAAWALGALLETAHRTLHLKREPRMTRFLAAQLGMSHYFDIRRAQKDFGYSTPISTTEGLNRLAADLSRMSEPGKTG